MSWQHSPSSAAASLAPNATPPASYDPGYQPRPPAGSSRRAIRGWLVSGLVIAGFAIPALALAAYFQASLGVVTVLLALLLAAIPLGIVVPTFLWLDRFEAEPTRYLVVAFLWGALVSAVLAARQLSAERIILMGRHTERTDLGREFGATDVVAERGAEGVERVLELTAGEGSHVVLEAVGHLPAFEQCLGVVRPGGVISRVGVPQFETAPVGFGGLFGRNITLNGGPAPVRAYLEQTIPKVLDGTINPGRVFDRVMTLEEAPQAYAAMDSRAALKVMLTP